MSFIKHNKYLFISTVLLIAATIFFVFSIFYATHYWLLILMFLSLFSALVVFIISIKKTKKIAKLFSIIGLIINSIMIVPYSLFSIIAIKLSFDYLEYERIVNEIVDQKYSTPEVFINSFDNYYVNTNNTYSSSYNYHYDDTFVLKDKLNEIEFEKVDYYKFDYTTNKNYYVYSNKYGPTSQRFVASLVVVEDGGAVMDIRVNYFKNDTIGSYSKNILIYFSYEKSNFASTYEIAKSIVE